MVAVAPTTRIFGFQKLQQWLKEFDKMGGNCKNLRIVEIQEKLSLPYIRNLAGQPILK